MKKQRRRSGFGVNTNSKLKRDNPQKKKEPAKRSQWGSRNSKAEETAEHSPEHRPSYEVQEIKIPDIKVKGERRALDPAKLNELMESISSLGLRTPITVSVVKQRRDWQNTKREWVLVSGLHRLEAMRQLGKTTIPCMIMEGDERHARMWEISENLHRADLTSAEYDEQVAEWVRMFQEGQLISGQNGQKIGRGRRKGGYSEAARKLPVKGKTHEAKRKNVARAVKAASIAPEAKDAANKAGLNSRSVRLKIAAEKTPEAQLAKVNELAKQKKTKKVDSLSAEDRKALEELIKAWNKADKLKRAFIKAAPNVQEKFIANIKRDRRRDTAKGWGNNRR
jgi:ParB family chromosome partitioning protein